MSSFEKNIGGKTGTDMWNRPVHGMGADEDAKEGLCDKDKFNISEGNKDMGSLGIPNVDLKNLGKIGGYLNQDIQTSGASNPNIISPGHQTDLDNRPICSKAECEGARTHQPPEDVQLNLTGGNTNMGSMGKPNVDSQHAELGINEQNQQKFLQKQKDLIS